MVVNGELQTVRYLGNRWSQSETDENLDLRGKYVVYIWYF